MVADRATRAVRATVRDGVLVSRSGTVDTLYRLDDAASREAEPDRWCGCGHHDTEHHGPRMDGACSATGCVCAAFGSL